MELFKDKYTPALIERTGMLLKQFAPALDQHRFRDLVFAEGWDELEFKGRIRRVALSMTEVLPGDYAEALHVLEQAAPVCAAWNACSCRISSKSTGLRPSITNCPWNILRHSHPIPVRSSRCVRLSRSTPKKRSNACWNGRAVPTSMFAGSPARAAGPACLGAPNCDRSSPIRHLPCLF